MKQNCWEFFKCGKAPHIKPKLRGESVCSVTISHEFDGVNGGQAAGRTCWSVSMDKKCGVHLADQYSRCSGCPFFRKVVEEEGLGFQRDSVSGN